MIELMAKQQSVPEEPVGDPRIRMIVDTEEEIRQAVGLRAIKMTLALRREVSKSEVVTEILRDALRAELSELKDKPFMPKKRPK